MQHTTGQRDVDLGNLTKAAGPVDTFELFLRHVRICFHFGCKTATVGAQDLVGVWVVDYIGGGTRHMSAEELDGSAKEPSAVSLKPCLQI